MLLKITIKSANSVKSKNVGKLTGLTVVDVFACCLFSQEEDSEEGVEEVGDGPDYNYILGMALWCLTKEKKEELCKQRDTKADELRQLRRKEPEDLWRNDLNTFLTELDVSGPLSLRPKKKSCLFPVTLP